jgi:transposase
MKKFRELGDRRQLGLLPASVEEYVGREDIVRYVDALVEEFDLREIEGKYSYQGRPAYSPRILVKVLVYGKLRGVNSSRELARALQENLRFIFLAQNERPDFRTISDFRKVHHAELAALLAQTIAIGVEEKLITLDFVALDGTKLLGFAARKSFKTPTRLRQDLKRLEAEIKRSIQEDIFNDEQEDKDYGNSDGQNRLPKKLQDKTALRDKLRQALAHHQQIPGEKPSKVSLTDPECRFMQGKGINPSYNALAAVDHSSMMAVGGYVSSATGDSSELIPLVKNVQKNTNELPKVITADRGFSKVSALAEIEQLGVDAFVALAKHRNSRKDCNYDLPSDSFTCLEGRKLNYQWTFKNLRRYRSVDCAKCTRRRKCMPTASPESLKTISLNVFQPQIERMWHKMTSPAGAAMRRLRASTVEPLFGIIKHAMRYRRTTLRTKNRVDSDWKLTLAAYNISKIASHYRNLSPKLTTES